MGDRFCAFEAQTREITQAELMRIWLAGRKTVLFITHQIDETAYRFIVLARRPGRINEIVSIDLPRPRTLDIKRTPTFVALVDHIWRLIERDVRASVLDEHAQPVARTTSAPRRR